MAALSHYQGKPAAFKGPRDSQQAGISIIHQELNLIPELTIAENIFLGREITGTLGRILVERDVPRSRQAA